MIRQKHTHCAGIVIVHRRYVELAVVIEISRSHVCVRREYGIHGRRGEVARAVVDEHQDAAGSRTAYGDIGTTIAVEISRRYRSSVVAGALI
jgi:hypothetical protein